MILAWLISLAAVPVLADTSVDPARRIMGRTTYPAKSWGEQSLLSHYAAALGKNVFLGLESKMGLSRRAPDLNVEFLLGLYFGPYGLMDWILE